jgi:mRNA-degrading endonuclease RelE of RelBE toxin-antitoxin system
LEEREGPIFSESDVASDKYDLLRLNTKVRKDLDDLHTANVDVAKDVYEAFDVIVTTPKRCSDRPRDIKHLEGPYGKLHNNLRCHYRFRLVKDHRIVYKVIDETKQISIIYIGPHP